MIKEGHTDYYYFDCQGRKDGWEEKMQKLKDKLKEETVRQEMRELQVKQRFYTISS